MSKQPTFLRRSVAVFGLLLAALMLGCGSKEEAGQNPEALEAIALLDLLDKDHKQQDPTSFVELQLGKFKISHSLPDSEGTLLVQFTLYGVMSESKKEQIEPNLPAIEKRVRDAVISVVQRAEVEQLGDPALNYVKAELVTSLNRVMRGRILKAVAFSEFSIIRR
ncbi:MAG: flagellar basal body-associated FliL family protein [Planctomycetaceae bacterium]